MINFYLNIYRKSRSTITVFALLTIISTNLLAQVPTISEFSPTSGNISTPVIISGTNFGATISANAVYFGAVKATITSASTTSLTVTVPVGSTYSPITVTTNSLTAYSVKPFVVTTSNPSSVINSESFTVSNTLTTGARPHGIASGDFDNDGKVDLVTSNYDDNTISILKNTSTTGAISFNTKTDLACGSGAFALSTGDLTGDGRLDIAVANYFAGTVSVYRNTSTSGAISFDPKVEYSTGSGPRIVSIGDLDGDGKPDLVVANDDGNSMSILKNLGTNGNISFGSKSTYYPGYHPRDIAIGDLDGDNKADVVVANFSSHSIVVYKNMSTPGTISLNGGTSYSTGSSPRVIAIADLNNDGLSDLAVTNHDGSSFSTFKNVSSGGTISFNSKVDFSCQTNPYGVTATDLNGDGKVDLAIANLLVGTVSLFKNTSTTSAINFSTKVDYAAQTGTISIAISDLDGDGKPDIAAANDQSSSITILKQAANILPIDLLNFSAEQVSTGILLKWQTASEKYASHFEIENSIDGEFEKIALVAAKSASSGSPYTFSHLSAKTGKNYYRLKLIDADGSFEYSQTIVADFSLSNNGFNVFPNPTTKSTVNVTYSIKEKGELQIINLLGSLVKTLPLEAGINTITVNLTGISKGTYMVLLKEKAGYKYQKLIIE